LHYNDLAQQVKLDKLIELGDRLFLWSSGVYGYITNEIYDPSYGVYDKKLLENCKYPDYVRRRGCGSGAGTITKGIKELMWVNYFGSPYIQEPDFNLPDKHVILSKGVRFQLTESPNDEMLCEPDFLMTYKKAIGLQWFWHIPRVYDWRIPDFDRSEMIRKPQI